MKIQMPTPTNLGVFVLCIVLLGIGLYIQPQSKVFLTDIWRTTKAPPSGYGPIPEISGSLSSKNSSGSVAVIPNSQLKYKINGVSTASLLIEVKYENSYYDYDYTIELGNQTEGSLYLEPPPTRTNAQIFITAIGETGKKSQPFVFTNQ